MDSQDQSALIDQTVQAFDNSATTSTPENGQALIAQWIEALGTSGATHKVASGLNQLKTELQQATPSGLEIQGILQNLADNTEEAAQSADEATQAALQKLAASLRNYSQQLS